MPETPLPAHVVSLLAAWALHPCGPLQTTRSSWVLPVEGAHGAAMLKVARIPDERAGYRLMTWYGGIGAARVQAARADALLLERARGGGNLADMARGGRDDEACKILCATAAEMHQPRATPYPDLHPLRDWFQPLFDLAPHHAALAGAAHAAQVLLADPRDVLPLHGDLHHGNVLDFGDRGWRAIDPHGLVGERLFDFANIFTNPDLDDPTHPVATRPGRLERLLGIVAAEANADPRRLLQWIVAWTGLSAAWFIGDSDTTGAAIDLEVNAIAAKVLGE